MQACPVLISHERTSHLHRFSVRDIALFCVLAHLPYVAGHLLATALLVPVAPLVVLVLAVQFVRVQSLRPLVVGLPHREAHPLPHRAVAVATVRHHTRHVTMSEIEGTEDATAVVLPRDVDAPAHPDAAVLRVETRTIHVADAVQVPVAVEGIAPSQAHGPHRAGEGVRETGGSAGAGAGAGTQRTAGMQKGRLVGVEAGPGARVRTGPKKKVGANHKVLALQTVQLLGSGSKARPRQSGRETRWSLGRCVTLFDVC
jgi:hypothetical protein